MSELHERMRTARNYLGLNQTEMAKSAGMSLRGYQSNERGESQASTAIMESLASSGINANWLLTGKGEMLTGSEPNISRTKPNPFEAQVKDNKEKINTLWECVRSTNTQIECLLKLHNRTRQPIIKRVWDWVFGNNVKA